MRKLSATSALAFAVSAALVAAAALSVFARAPVEAPPPRVEAPATSAAAQSIVLAGGGFWGVQEVFEHVKGVRGALAGYAGGTTPNPTYAEVSAGRTDYVEAVKITYDPRVIDLGDILRVFFSVAHDPTQATRQGWDEGPQYRPYIFPSGPAQEAFARTYVAELEAAKTFKQPIATRIEANARFYPAESYHQHYAALHPDDPYVALNDQPKVDALKRLFPALFREAPVRLASP
jgi:peptide-methionine (S)-S-oxide reductase